MEDNILENGIEEYIHNPMLELTDDQQSGKEPIVIMIDELEELARFFYNLGREDKSIEEGL